MSAAEPGRAVEHAEPGRAVEHVELRAFVPRPLADDMAACHVALTGLMDDARDVMGGRLLSRYDDPEHHATAYCFAVKRDPAGRVMQSEPLSGLLPHWADARMYVLDTPAVGRG